MFKEISCFLQLLVGLVFYTGRLEISQSLLEIYAFAFDSRGRQRFASYTRAVMPIYGQTLLSTRVDEKRTSKCKSQCNAQCRRKFGKNKTFTVKNKRKRVRSIIISILRGRNYCMIMEIFMNHYLTHQTASPWPNG